MVGEFQIKTQAAQPTLSVRIRTRQGDLPQVLGKYFGMIGAYLVELREPPAGPPYAGYHNMDMQDMDVEIGFPVAKTLAGRGEMQPGVIPAAERATCLHTGPYEDLRNAYEQLHAFVVAQGREFGGAAYEYYVNDPAQVAPEQLQTLVSVTLM